MVNRLLAIGFNNIGPLPSNCEKRIDDLQFPALDERLVIPLSD